MTSHATLDPDLIHIWLRHCYTRRIIEIPFVLASLYSTSGPIWTTARVMIREASREAEAEDSTRGKSEKKHVFCERTFRSNGIAGKTVRQIVELFHLYRALLARKSFQMFTIVM